MFAHLYTKPSNLTPFGESDRAATQQHSTSSSEAECVHNESNQALYLHMIQTRCKHS